MFFSAQRFQKAAEDLSAARYHSMESIAPLCAMEGQLDADTVYTQPPAQVSGFSLDIGDAFAGRDRYVWLEKELTLPQSKEGFEVVGLFDFGTTGDCHNSGFESLLWVNGEPYQAVDSNHKEVFFGALAGQTVRLTWLLWTGLEGGGIPQIQHHLIQQAQVGYLHKATHQLYHLTRAITESLPFTPEQHPQHAPLQGALEAALHQLNWDEACLHTSAQKALAQLEQALEKLPKHTPVTVHTVGHTHVDVAWLWRYKHTREKIQRSFSTVLRLMEEYPEYVFMHSTPQVYAFLKQDNPALYARIRQRIAEGRWETDGGMWVEADCNLTSGESLVRQLVQGIRFFREEFGHSCEYLWLPDVFGYSWALPQLLRQCGINTFMTTKISWNQYNSIPNDVFRWRGIDGSEILTYFINVPDDSKDYHARGSTYNGVINARSVAGSWERFANKELSQDVLFAFGYGDGGGGANREMLEQRRALNSLPTMPAVKPGKAGDFFQQLHGDIDNATRYVSTWDGELYLECHRGTYTSQAHNKKQNRRLEFRLTQAEWLLSLAELAGGSYPQEQLNQNWQTLLLNQFHDVIPGSSIHEVYQDSTAHYAAINKSLATMETDAFSHLLAAEENSWALVNSSSFAQESLVLIPEKREGSFCDAGGNPLPSQPHADGTLVLASALPLALSKVEFKAQAPAAAPSPFVVDAGARTLQTPYLTLEWEPTGELSRIYDKKAGREVLAGKGNVLRGYEDRPINYDAWDIDLAYSQKYETLAAQGEPQVVEDGPLRMVLRFCYQWRSSRIVQDVVVYSHCPRIDFETEVDWHEDHRLLKTEFAVDIRTTKATYDIQFGHVERPTHWNTSWDWARFEVCAHKWADLSEQGYGVSLLNDCKYGYGIRDNVMTLSLLKSAKHPDFAADMGIHHFVYSLLPHTGDAVSGGVLEHAAQLNQPLAVRSGKPRSIRRLIFADTSAVCIDAVKKSEDGRSLVVRLHECKGGRHTVSLQSDFGSLTLIPCNLLEEPQGQPIPASQFAIKPFEVQTFLVEISE